MPAYARGGRRKTKSGVRTWMILAPVGALALAAGAVVMLTAPATEPMGQPSAAPALEAPALAPISPAEVVPPATPAGEAAMKDGA